jgi:delta(3,5)-delta(2,4)-dienoyl-CoA isomerase
MATLQHSISSLELCSKPVIAAVHGLCLGAGIDIMSACDVRLCAEGTVFAIKVRFSSFLPFSSPLSGCSAGRPRQTLSDALERQQEVDIGLAADIGSLQRLPKTTGNASLLYELALTARNFGPAEAEKLGFVSRTVGGGKEGVVKEALELAKVIACALLFSLSLPPSRRFGLSLSCS